MKDKKSIEDKSLIPVIQHHENYDGSGYPYGIGGTEIDLYGRLSRIVDVYDAITTRRCYGSAMNPFTALKEMREGMVNCFDMELFREFIYFLGPRGSRLIKEDNEIVGGVWHTPLLESS